MVNSWMKDGVEANLAVIINLFDGNIFKALEKAREFNQIEVRMSAKTVERLLIKLLISNAGWSDEKIVEVISTERHKVAIDRVRRIRKEMENEQ